MLLVEGRSWVEKLEEEGWTVDSLITRQRLFRMCSVEENTQDSGVRNGGMLLHCRRAEMLLVEGRSLGKKLWEEAGGEVGRRRMDSGLTYDPAEVIKMCLAEGNTQCSDLRTF